MWTCFMEINYGMKLSQSKQFGPKYDVKQNNLAKTFGLESMASHNKLSDFWGSLQTI